MLDSSIGAVRQRAAQARDYMTLATVELLAHLDDDLEEKGWDQPSRLLVVYRRMLPEKTLAALGPNTEGIGFEAHGVGPTPLGRGGQEIAERIAAVALALTELDPGALESMVPENLFAWAIFHEAWLIGGPGITREEVERYRGDFSKHPQRREIRNVIAVDTAGTVLMLNRVRGEHPMERKVYADDPNSKEAAILGGRVTNALRMLMRASLGAREKDLAEGLRSEEELMREHEQRRDHG